MESAAFPILPGGAIGRGNAPVGAGIAKVNPCGYLDVGRRTLFGFARGAPGASVGIGEKQAPILIAAAGRAFYGPGGSRGGDDCIQPEDSQQKESHKGNSSQEALPAGLQNGILHDRLQDVGLLLHEISPRN